MDRIGIFPQKAWSIDPSVIDLVVYIPKKLGSNAFFYKKSNSTDFYQVQFGSSSGNVDIMVMWTFLVGDTDKSGWCGLPEDRTYRAFLFFSSTKNKYHRIKLS